MLINFSIDMDIYPYRDDKVSLPPKWQVVCVCMGNIPMHTHGRTTSNGSARFPLGVGNRKPVCRRLCV